MLGQGHIPMVTKKSPEIPKSALYKQLNTNTKLSILPTMLQQNDNDENNKRKINFWTDSMLLLLTHRAEGMTMEK
jgi:hypothetical protein